MKAEIKDKSKMICRALNAVGYRINSADTELILNIAEHVKEQQGKASLQDLVEIKELVEDLFKP